MKVALEGYGNEFNIETINRVDSVIIFKDDVSEYEENCLAGRSKGPFCRQAQLSNDFIAELTEAIENNMIESSKFVSMVFNVDKTKGKWRIVRTVRMLAEL